jgi:hypothetical protein
MLEICTSGSVGVPGGQPPWDDPAGGRMTGSYVGESLRPEGLEQYQSTINRQSPMHQRGRWRSRYSR